MPLKCGHQHHRNHYRVEDAQTARQSVARFQVVIALPTQPPANEECHEKDQQQNQNPDVGASVRHDGFAFGAYCLTNSLLGSMTDSMIQLSCFCKISTNKPMAVALDDGASIRANASAHMTTGNESQTDG